MKPKNKLPPWLRPRIAPRVVLVGVGWYTQKEWAKARAAAVDPERFEESYAQWLEMAETALAELQGAGVAAQRSNIKVAELLAWCLVNNKPNNAASRAEFVSGQERKIHQQGM